MTLDPFGSLAPSREGAFANALAITPDDDADLPVIPRAVYCSEGGLLALTMQNGETITIGDELGEGPQAFDVAPLRILATGTTATGLILFW